MTVGSVEVTDGFVGAFEMHPEIITINTRDKKMIRDPIL
jgi:hypothetical protein